MIHGGFRGNGADRNKTATCDIRSVENLTMNRKLISLANVFVAVFSLAVVTQVADAQIFGGRQCCDQHGYSGYGQTSSYDYGQMGNYGYGPMGSYGVGSGMMGSYGYPTSAGYGIQAYGSAGYGMGGNCGSGCGHMVFRRSASYCNPPCGYSSYGMNSGYGMGGGCYSGCQQIWSLGCRQRSNCGYQRMSNFCGQLSGSYTGAEATCCTPVPNCCGTQSGGYTVQPGYGTPKPTLITPSPIINPAPPTEPVPATAPTPGT